MTKERTMFASNSLIEHGVRGVLGVGLLWFAISIASTHPFSSLGLGIATLIVFRGCPICWTIGLFETINMSYIRFKKKRLKN